MTPAAFPNLNLTARVTLQQSLPITSCLSIPTHSYTCPYHPRER